MVKVIFCLYNMSASLLVTRIKLCIGETKWMFKEDTNGFFHFNEIFLENELNTRALLGHDVVAPYPIVI